MLNAREGWRDIAQSFERGFWESFAEREGPPSPKALAKTSRIIWERFWARADQFRGQTVMDIGPGPTQRMEFFDSGCFIAIEPLADVYRRLPWASLERYAMVYQQPAEEPIPMVRVCDAVLSLNALDHCYDLNLVLRNAFSYLRPGGLLFVSFDVDKKLSHDPTHPISLTHERATEVIQEEGFVIDRIEAGRVWDDHARAWSDSWGGGTAYHWWARRAV